MLSTSDVQVGTIVAPKIGVSLQYKVLDASDGRVILRPIVRGPGRRVIIRSVYDVLVNYVVVPK